MATATGKRPAEFANITLKEHQAPMEIIYFTVAAMFLYVVADWILKRMETAAGKRFEYRSLIFFVILLTMAVSSFTIIQRLTGQ